MKIINIEAMNRMDPEDVLLTLALKKIAEPTNEDSLTKCLCLVQKMFSNGSINEQKRDKLKELVFDEDPKLLAFFNLVLQ